MRGRSTEARVPGARLRLAVACGALAIALAAAAGPGAAYASDTSAWSSRVTGRSVRGRPISAWRFGEGEKRLLIVGGIHGPEYGDDVAYALIRYLKAHPSAVPTGTQIDVIPRLNPDGVAHAARGNARHVDLNRNMPTKVWRRVLDRRDPSRRLGLTGGRRRASEPETRLLVSYLEAGGFDAVVLLHSRAGFVSALGPGAGTLARKLSKPCRLRLGRIGYGDYIRGSIAQYVAQELHTPAISVELKSRRLTRGLRLGLIGLLE